MALTLAASITGCADSIDQMDGPGSDNSGTSDSDDPIGEARILTSDNADGTLLSIVDATSEDGWVYWDLDSGEEVFPADPQDDDQWDLGVQRFRVITNGGDRGTGGVQVAILENTDPADVTQAPNDGYLDSAEEVDDSGDAPIEITGWGWYDYNPVDNTLSPANVVYVVRSTDGNYFRISVVDYYDEFGTSGFMHFHWGDLDAPASR